MEVIVAKSAGFCFGVKRAVDTVYEQISRAEDKPIYTYGPIIHNEEVVKDLAEKGVQVMEGEEAIAEKKKGIVIIRSHGVSRHVQEHLEQNGFQIVDATCPFVKKIHRIVEQESQNGSSIIIIGNPSHPEVEGIVGWSSTPAVVVETAEDIEKLPDFIGKKVCIVSQTTFNYKKFKDLVEKIQKKGYDITVLNTICNATQERQIEAKRISADVDGMLVVGGKHSSNTQKLYEICKKECNNTHFIQTTDDLDPAWFGSSDRVGITAGASTPNNIIEEVQTHVRFKF